MKTRNYYRPSTVSLGKKKRVVRRKSGARFFLKFFLLLIILTLCIGGGWLVLSKGYDLLVQTNVSDWQVKNVVVNGVSEPLQAQLLALVQPYQGHSFSTKQSVALSQTIRQKYPMLKRVKVKRSLLGGTLMVSAVHREPLAQFTLSNGSVKYIDAQGVIYTDATLFTPQKMLPIELEGPIPEKLNSELMELVQSALKLRRELDFSLLHMNLTNNTVKMYMPDHSVIDFGSAIQLKSKADRAVQILALARKKYTAPFVLDFRFFENGKVFLTQRAH